MNFILHVARGIGRNYSRILWPIIIGTIMIRYGEQAAQFSGIPALSPWSLFVGGSFYVFAATHVLRRMYFPHLDLQAIAKEACDGVSGIGAGLVFIGICLVLCALIFLLGAAIRV